MTALSIEDRNGIRMFAFAIANTNLVCHLLDDGEAEPDYLDAIRRTPPLLGALFASFLNEAYLCDGPDTETWLLGWLCSPTPDALPTLNPNAPGWMRLVVAFADALAADRLGGVPSPSRILHCNGGSPLELVFAVLTNVLDLDEQGQPRNPEPAWERAAEMAHWLLDRHPPATPFTPAETALV